MLNLHKLTRLNNIHVKYLRKIRCCNYCRDSRHVVYIYPVNHNMYSKKISRNVAACSLNFFSTSVGPQVDDVVESNVFEKVCEETLQSLTEFFEELIDTREMLKNADVSYSSGVLTINLGEKIGTYVINRQSPNRQIWLSSPVSGPKRYDYSIKDQCWMYKHDMIPLHKLLQNEISNALGENINFSKCLYSKV